MQSDKMIDVSPYDRKNKQWRVVVETPKGSHNKYRFDEKLGAMILSTVLPEGMAFPYDFGFLPSTLADDGDPLDVLLLMDEPAFPGCIILARMIGVIEATQRENGKRPQANDRIVAVPIKCRTYGDCRNLKELNAERLHEIEQFFVSYNRTRDKQFKVIHIGGPKKADKVAHEGMNRWNDRR
jgi:inorganic pyrophosphatase